MKENKKFIIVMRHGERTDFSGMTPKFGEWDPELTKRGEEQAFKAGNIISKQLQEMNLISDNAFIQVVSSPFVRTIQTARNVIKGIKSANVFKVNSTIQIDCHICEMINYEFYGNFPMTFLNFVHKTKLFQNEFKDQQLEMISTYDPLPKKEENDYTCMERLKFILM